MNETEAAERLGDEDVFEAEHDAPAEQTAPPTVFDGLREQYAKGTEDRRTTLPIASGRYDGNLAARYNALPYDEIRKLQRRVERIGSSTEAELRFKASVLAKACDQILYRFADGEELKPMHEGVPEWTEPVGFDDRLCSALGIEGAKDLDAASIVRLVFKDPLVLEGAFAAYDGWRSEALRGDDDEDEGGEGSRPT